MQSLRDPDNLCLDAEIARAHHPFTQKAGDIHGLRDRLMDVMWEDAGVMRTGEGLNQAITRIDELKAEFLETGLPNHDRVFNLTWHDWINLQNLIQISEVIARAALWRENSRGAHYREDHPLEGELESSYFTVAREEDDAIAIVRKPVVFSVVAPGQSLLDDEEPAATRAEG